MYKLIDLPYDFDALEPYIDAKTMELHYSKHHQGYVDKLNTALESLPEFQNLKLEELLSKADSIPEENKNAVLNNGGQVYNHNLFWQIMSPDGGGLPSGNIAEKIDAAFESFENFKDKFSTTAGKHFGSGWAWLSIDSDKLIVESTQNHDNPFLHGRKPILGLDVWEHAYYLKYQNRRPEYIEAWWNVINWKKVEELYKS